MQELSRVSEIVCVFVLVNLRGLSEARHILIVIVAVLVNQSMVAPGQFI